MHRSRTDRSPQGRWARAFSFSLLALVAACTHVEDVKGPNGESSHLISCHGARKCYAAADTQCPAGYVIRTLEASTEHENTTTQILITCKVDLPAEETAAPVAGPSSSAVCGTAANIDGEFAAYRAGRTPGATRLDELPQRSDFMQVCGEMPERVQRCMHEHWRQAHAQSCEAVLSRLEPSQQRKIDGLFLAAPAAAEKSAP